MWKQFLYLQKWFSEYGVNSTPRVWIRDRFWCVCSWVKGIAAPRVKAVMDTYLSHLAPGSQCDKRDKGRKTTGAIEWNEACGSNVESDDEVKITDMETGSVTSLASDRATSIASRLTGTPFSTPICSNTQREAPNTQGVKDRRCKTATKKATRGLPNRRNLRTNNRD